MKKMLKRLGGSSEGRILGDQTFAAISAVEGISLSASSKKRLQAMKDRKLTTKQQRAEVIRAYRQAKLRG
jgi:hypothetical protein